MMRVVSSYLRDQKGNILGYDPINEPEPGSNWTEAYIPDPDNPFNFANGCPQFDQKYLAAFYQQCAIPNLRAGHPEAMIWYEPNIYFDYNAPTFLPDLGVENVGFNFHNYDGTATGKNRYRDPVNNALSYQSSADVPLLCSEFGGTTVIPDIAAVADISDHHMLSWIFWAWFNNAQFNFATATSEATDPRKMGVVQIMSEPLVPPNVNEKMLKVLTRVYPRVIAGTPTKFHTMDDRFSFEYSTQLPNDGPVATGKTVIVVPAALYPNGFDVSAPGASSVNQLDGIVEIAVDSPTPTTMVVDIRPK